MPGRVPVEIINHTIADKAVTKEASPSGPTLDFFTNTVAPEKFKSTEPVWKELCLHDPWSVGIVENIIELRIQKNKEDWENFYYKMGDIRHKELEKLEADVVKTLNDELLVTHDTEVIEGLDWKVKNINYQNGRTREELDHKGELLHRFCEKKGMGLTLNECKETVRFRVVCEAWNSMVIREKNTAEKLQEHFKDLRIVRTDSDFDHSYAVDFELWQGDVRLCGVLVKPSNYFKSFAPYIKRAKAINGVKHNDYKGDFGRPVFEVISDLEGTILNHDVIEDIAEAVKAHP